VPAEFALHEVAVTEVEPLVVPGYIATVVYGPKPSPFKVTVVVTEEPTEIAPVGDKVVEVNVGDELEATPTANPLRMYDCALAVAPVVGFMTQAS
jgi:hypothetical protein